MAMPRRHVSSRRKATSAQDLNRLGINQVSEEGLQISIATQIGRHWEAPKEHRDPGLVEIIAGKRKEPRLRRRIR